jgi:NADPH-dependent curcumin reductase CurA
MLITNAQLQPGEGLLLIDIRGGIAQRIPPSRQKNRCAGDRHIGYPWKLEWARQLDADHSINHRKQNLVAEVDRLPDHRGVDVVPDCVAGDIWQKGLAIVGHLVTCGATAGGQPMDDLAAI